MKYIEKQNSAIHKFTKPINESENQIWKFRKTLRIHWSDKSQKFFTIPFHILMVENC